MRRSTFAVVFLVGFFLGGWFVYNVKRNTMTFEVRNNTKLFVHPQAGDRITWHDEAGLPASIAFSLLPGDNIPCRELRNDSSRQISDCTVETREQIFTYDCKRPACFDPGVDTRTKTGGHASYLPSYLRFLFDLFVSFFAVTQETSRSYAMNAAPNVATPQDVGIYCDAGQAKTKDVQISAGYDIEWYTNSGKSWTITPQSGMCSDGSGPISSAGKKTCRANEPADKPYTYNVTLDGCGRALGYARILPAAPSR